MGKKKVQKIFGILWDCVLLSGMIKGKSKKVIRNGKVYIGCWVDKDIEKKAQEQAKKDKRTFSAFVELALAWHCQA